MPSGTEVGNGGGRRERRARTRPMQGRAQDGSGADAGPMTEAFGKKRERTKKNGAKKLPLSK